MINKELTTRIRESKELETLVDEIRAEIESVKNVLKKHMESEQKEKMTLYVFKVRHKTFQAQRAFKFKATHIELYKQYSKSAVLRRFSAT